MTTAVIEVKGLARQRLAQRVGDQDLTGACFTHHPRCGVYRQPTDLLATHLDLPEVEARPSLDAELAERRANRQSTAQARQRPVEGGEEGIAGSVDFVPTEPGQLGTYRGAISGQQVAPALVTKLHDG